MALRALALPLALLLSAAAAVPARAQEQYDIVNTTLGQVRGAVHDQHRAFRGIRFAEAPEGPRRFASPVPAEPWAPEVRDALRPGAICPGSRAQTLIALFPGIEESEDCLFLNVYTPTRDRIVEPLPVLFWIYGGAFLLGDGWEVGMYDGAYLVSTHDVILVTHNYRLGPFGFLVTPESNGNYGLEDQRLALQWVVDNIANFGGDPNNITIFGESAGGMSVAAHLVSPPSAGLFQRAIIHSDPFTLSTKTRENALATGERFAQNVNCTFDLECLRTVPMRDIAFNGNVGTAGRTAVLRDLLTWSPTIDDRNLFAEPLAAFQSGQAHDVPIIIGTNADEVTLFQDIIDAVLAVVSRLTGRDLDIYLGEETYTLTINTIFRDKAADVLARYPPLPNNASNYDQLIHLGTLYLFECSTRQAALGFVRTTGNTVYGYRFAHTPDFAPGLGRILKCFDNAACHALEIPYLFHPPSVSVVPIADRFTPEEEAMSQAMIDYWVGFAYGNVNREAVVPWPTLDTTSESLLLLNTPIAQTQYNSEECNFWDSVGYIY